MVNTMETIDIKLNESETQMFGQLFTYYDSANEGIVPQSVAKQVLNASNLDQNVLDQIIELSGSSRLQSVSRHQFYAMLKLVGAAQSGLPLSTETTNALTIPLPQLSPIVVETNKQIIANNIDENIKSEAILQMTGHLPPPPTKASVRSNRRNNQFSNSGSNDNIVRQPIEAQNNYNSLNNNNIITVTNNLSTNHIQNEQQFETETTNSRSSSANELNDDSPINTLVEKPYDSYRDKSWSEFNDKNKDKPLNWANYEEEDHLLENEEEDEEEEENHEIKSNSSEEFEESEDIWNISEEQRHYYTNQFKAMQSNINGIITGNKAKDFFEKSNLPIQELSRIWWLSDIDKDGALTLNEFCIAMHLVVLRRNNIELPPQLPPSLLPPISSGDSKLVLSLNRRKSNDLVNECVENRFKSVSLPKHNDLNDIRTKKSETLSPPTKQWTKFTDSPTHQIVVTTASSPPSNSSSAGLQSLANFDFSTASIVRDPKILHPVALRLSPDGQPIRYDSNESNSQSLDSTVHSVTVTNGLRTTITIQGKKDPPPPPPPRPHRSHARSSSLDLNRVIVRSGAAHDLIPSQIPSYIKVSNSEYGLTAPQKEVPNLSLNQRNLGAFQAYRKNRTETSLKNNINNSYIDSLKIRYKFPPEVPIPDISADSTELWQTIKSFQEYNKVLTNINTDLLRELIKVSEEKNSLELKLSQLSNGCKL